MGLTLTREVRFGLHADAEGAERAEMAGEGGGVGRTGGGNGFAGNPELWGVAPFLTLAATVAGEADAMTGMLINIKEIDRVLREEGVAYLRGRYFAEAEEGRWLAGGYMRGLMGRLRGRFVPYELRRLRLGLSPYLAYAVEDKEAHVVEMALKFEFSAAHRLHSAALTERENAEVFGKCNNPNGHGHNYEMEVVVAGEPGGKTGAVVGVTELQRVVNERIIEVFDHKHLNLDCAEFAELNPTVENIAKVLYGRLKGHVPGEEGGAKLVAMRVWETPRTMCEYRSDEQ